MTLVVGAGTLLLLHQLSVSVVVACATQFQILLLHRVSWYLLDGQPVQRLLSGEAGQDGEKKHSEIIPFYLKPFKVKWTAP